MHIVQMWRQGKLLRSIHSMPKRLLYTAAALFRACIPVLRSEVHIAWPDMQLHVDHRAISGTHAYGLNAHDVSIWCTRDSQAC